MSLLTAICWAIFGLIAYVVYLFFFKPIRVPLEEPYGLIVFGGETEIEPTEQEIATCEATAFLKEKRLEHAELMADVTAWATREKISREIVQEASRGQWQKIEDLAKIRFGEWAVSNAKRHLGYY